MGTVSKHCIYSEGVSKIDESDFALLVSMVMRGEGHALRQYIEPLGLEERLSFLREVVQQSRKARRNDKKLSALSLVVQWRPEEDVRADSKLNYHLQIQLCQEVAKVFAGPCLYNERLYLYDPLLRREVEYVTFDQPVVDKGGPDELSLHFEELNLKMSVPVIEKLVQVHGITDEPSALEKLQDTEWLEQHGYGHIAHVLSSAVGARACRAVFAERQKETTA